MVYRPPDGDRTDLEDLYVELEGRWSKSVQSRDDALHLLFLSWWHWVEPPFLTGLNQDRDPIPLWKEIFETFGSENSDDLEFLHISWLMLHIGAPPLDSEEDWLVIAEKIRQRLRRDKPEGFPPTFFECLGEYGDYFAHHARSAGPPYG